LDQEGTDPTHLVILLVVVLILVIVGAVLFKKSPRLRRFKSDQNDIWQECSSSKCASINGVGYLI